MKYFAYCRKSSEGEERQALSIPAQVDEIKRVFGDTNDIEIAEWFEEKMSAKAPGRPVWSAMIKQIEKGEADGIVAWHPDRLARNSVDGGWIIHLLDRRVLKDLKFVSYSYEQSPQGMFMLQIMFGQSKYYVDSLSVNVKRGIRKKLEMGWLPNKAPLGYRNDRETSTIAIDPERFPLLRRAWDLLLTGAYSVREINNILNNDWGFRTPVRSKSGGKVMALSATYKMFGSIFYAGVLDWHGSLHTGKHEPMVTLDEFDRARKILGQPGRPKAETRSFDYTGLIRCACGLSITAEKKTKPSGRCYTYYRCTRRAWPRCDEPALRVEIIEGEFLTILRSIRLPEEVTLLVRNALKGNSADINQLRNMQRISVEKALAKTRQELRTLTDLRIREMIDDEEYIERRKQLLLLELQHNQSLEHGTARSIPMFELGESVILLRKHAADWLAAGNREDKRLIVQSICSNPVLSGGKLNVQAKIPFERVESTGEIPYQLAVVEAVRTLAQDEKGAWELIEVVKCLKARALARQSGRPVPSLSPDVPIVQNAPRGRLSWRTLREPLPGSYQRPAT